MAGLSGFLPDLRPGERRLTGFMVANYFLLLVFYYLLKPARDSLFLVQLEPSQLPLVYILTALVAAPVTAAYARAGMRRRLDRLIALTTVVLMISLVLMRWLVQIRYDWVYYAFYGFVSVAGGLTTSQFWLLANGVFDATQAKRLFPVLGLGGIAGAFVGGEITSLLVRNLGISTEDLLLVGVVVLAAAGFLSRQVWKLRPAGFDGPRGTATSENTGGVVKGIVKPVLRSRHLMLTVGIISLTVMTASFVDFQFKTISWQTYSSERELTAFLGRFYGRMSLVSLGIQILLAARLLRAIGVGGVLLVLPGVLALGTTAMVVAPGIAAAMFLRGSDIGLKYSLDKTSRELLFLPIPLALKKRTKVFIDMFVDRWARGVAGGLLLLCTAVLKLDLSGIALLTLFLLLVWLILAWQMRGEYVNSFRRSLSRRDFDLADLRVRIDDSAALSVVISSLASPARREVLYALEMLGGIQSPSLADAVRPLLGHESPEVRQRALKVLAENGGLEDRGAVEGLIEDPDLAVRSSALSFLVHHRATDDEAAAEVAELLHGPAGSRNAAVEFLATDPSAEPYRELLDSDAVEAVLADGSESGTEGRRVLAGIDWLPAGYDGKLWERLLDDPQRSVVEAAMGGIGRRGDLDHTDWLLQRLDDRNLKSRSRLALAEMARSHESILVRLDACLKGTDPVEIRTLVEIPRILARVPSQASVEMLLGILPDCDSALRYESLKALGKLRAGYSHLRFDSRPVAAELLIEADRYADLARLEPLLPNMGESAQLLTRAVQEVQQRRLESVFRMLGLLYPAQDLLNAYRGLVSGHRQLRASAREFLDNLLNPDHRQLLESLLDEDRSGVRSPGRKGLSLSQQSDTPSSLAYIGTHCDAWLAACAINAGAPIDNPEAQPYLQRTGEDMLTAIEKALLLQNVEVFAGVPTDQLAALASIAREVAVLGGDIIYREHEPADALYLVLSGNIRLHQGDRDVTRVGRGESFGTWALFHDEPQVLTATALEDARLLRIDRNEFNELLADDVRIAQGIIGTVARRLRELAERAV